MSQPKPSEKIIKFVETYCRVPEGALVGQPIQLLEFQKKFIRDVYDNVDENGERITRRAYLSLGRKNGKTALIACLLLAHVCGPERVRNSQIVCGARSREQASVIFNLACKIINFSPELTRVTRIVPSSKRIIGLKDNVEFKALAAEGSKNLGLSVLVGIIDEIGAVRGPTDSFVESITTAQGAHKTPLLIAISTQAPTDADLFSVWLDDAERSQDPAIVSHVYTAPVDCDLQDEAAWKAANPALDVFRSRADVKAQAEQAERMPSAENGFRNLTLNQRVNSFSPFVSPSVWKAGNGPVADFGEALVFGGLDLSATTDLTALVLVARIDGILHVQPHFWMPADSVASAAKRDRAPYDVWVKQGFLRTTQGKVIDYSFVANDIAEICSGLNIQKIAFDRWRMDRLTTELDRAGISLPVEPFGQGFASMSPALEALESDLLQDRLIHGGQPVLTMCAANAVSVSDPAGSRKLEKNKSTGRIDGLVALAMACGIEATNGGEVSTASPWDDPTFSLFNGT